MVSTSDQPSVEIDNLKREVTCVEDVGAMENGQGKEVDVMTTYRSYNPEYAAELEKKLVRKIDLHIIPLVVIIYIFSYLDRNSVRTTFSSQIKVFILQPSSDSKDDTDRKIDHAGTPLRS
jgi:hypothetical protein